MSLTAARNPAKFNKLFKKCLNQIPISECDSHRALQLKRKAGTMNIPTNLNECFAELDERLTEVDREIITKSADKKIMNNLHHGLGRNIRNDWGLWESSELKNYFESLGVWHADDMSGIIFHSYWCHVRKQPINLDKQIKHYQDYWEDNYPNDIPKGFFSFKGKFKNLLK